MTVDGELTTLVSFNRTNGSHPCSALVLGKDDNFYGTTEEGGIGPGTVFKLTANGVLTTLVSFDFANGAYPTAPLIIGSDGNFYGTTSSGGGDVSGWGTIFQMTSNGVLQTLVSFNGRNGAYPNAGLVFGPDANLYGTTFYGGSDYHNDNAPGNGTVFQVTSRGLLTTLVSFDGTNGSQPLAPLVLGSDKNLYGTTITASTGGGVVFRLVTAPKLRTPTIQPGGSVLLSAAGMPNEALELWVTPDLSSDLTSWTLLSTNFFDDSGNFSFTDALAFGQHSRFYRLSVP